MTKDDRPPSSHRQGGPSAARWIVSESSGRWAIGLRREASAAGIRLHEARSLADGWSMLHRFPASFLVAELTRSNVESLLDRLAGVERLFPQARVAVVAERSLGPYQWLMREAGAVWFAVSPRELWPIVALTQRHLQLAPTPAGDCVQQIWDSLPWKPVAET